VVSVEPIRADNPLLTAKNILITPHTAWAPVETRKRLLDVVYDNLKGYLNGQIQNNITQIKGEGRP
jgi:glycerate dehydrogenase